MTLTLDQALTLVRAAIKAGREAAVPLAVAVVDLGGHIVASARSEQAGYIHLKVAERKAAASANFKAPTHGVLEMIKGDAVLLHAVMNEPDLSLLPGGLAIVIGGMPVGGLGIAGGHYSQDQAIGEKALAALSA
jgi:uncharacterized protein GlcG (DUF336 family)